LEQTSILAVAKRGKGNSITRREENVKLSGEYPKTYHQLDDYSLGSWAGVVFQVKP
jgi:hypothetical protein